MTLVQQNAALHGLQLEALACGPTAHLGARPPHF